MTSFAEHLERRQHNLVFSFFLSFFLVCFCLPLVVPMIAYKALGNQEDMRPYCTGMVASVAYDSPWGMSISPKVRPAMTSLRIHRGLYRGSQPTMGTLSSRYCLAEVGKALVPRTARLPTLFQVTSVWRSFLTALTTFILTDGGGKWLARERERVRERDRERVGGGGGGGKKGI